MKKLEMEWTIHLHNYFVSDALDKTQKEPGILRFGKELIMFIRDFFSYHSLQVQLGFKI